MCELAAAAAVESVQIFIFNNKWQAKLQIAGEQ